MLLMGQLTISMAIFNSYMLNYQRVNLFFQKTHVRHIQVPPRGTRKRPRRAWPFPGRAMPARPFHVSSTKGAAIFKFPRLN